MNTNNWSGVEQRIRGVVDDLKEALSWSWDGRFEAALAEFPASDKERILSLVQPRFDSLWDSASLSKAPPRVVKLCKEIGGLRSGQLLLASDPEEEILVLGAWWPWGNGKTISLRLIPTAMDDKVGAWEEFLNSYRGWFGL